MSVLWNPWHGCIKYSEGCKNCYVYRIDKKADRRSDEIHKNADFDLPLKRGRDGSYKIKSGETVYTCLSSDFFLDKADIWRNRAWEIIRERNDLNFVIITKRILRFGEQLPEDFPCGFDHVTVACTCENQKRADQRLPFFLSLPIKHKMIICEPLLGAVDLSPYLDGRIENVVVGGESGDFDTVRPCDFDWVLGIRDACIMSNTPFYFKQTGSNFIRDGRIYRVPRKLQHIQADKAMINVK